MRLARIKDLLNKDALERQFKEHVVGDVPFDIEQKVQALTTWLVERNQELWVKVVDSVSQHREKHSDHIIGQVGRSFEVDRAGLIDDVSRVAGVRPSDHLAVRS